MVLDVDRPAFPDIGRAGAPDIEIEKTIQAVFDEYAEGLIISSAGLAELIVAALRIQSFLK